MTAEGLNKQPASNPTMERLEDQIRWYSRQARRNRSWYKWLKGITVVSALFIPLLSTKTNGGNIAAGLGIAIAIAEGLQQLNQFQANWIAYRSTAEGLKHEKFLYLALAGPYGTAERPLPLLAERVEALVSQENSKWTGAQEQSGKKAAGSQA